MGPISTSVLSQIGVRSSSTVATERPLAGSVLRAERPELGAPELPGHLPLFAFEALARFLLKRKRKAGSMATMMPTAHSRNPHG